MEEMLREERLKVACRVSEAKTMVRRGEHGKHATGGPSLGIQLGGPPKPAVSH